MAGVMAGVMEDASKSPATRPSIANWGRHDSRNVDSGRSSRRGEIDVQLRGVLDEESTDLVYRHTEFERGANRTADVVFGQVAAPVRLEAPAQVGERPGLIIHGCGTPYSCFAVYSLDSDRVVRGWCTGSGCQ